ncbi:MAG: hypothetical protein WCW67_01550 [Candidatus Margulisiibacteriota bacterium]|jgi:hypothetical protein
MRIERKGPPITPGNLAGIREIVTSRFQRATSIIISPASLYRQLYTFNLAFISSNGRDTQQLREPFEAAARLFRQVEKIVIKRGAKAEDIAALFERLNNKTSNLRDFSRPNIEIVFRPQRVEQAPATIPQTAPIPQPPLPRPEVEKPAPAPQPPKATVQEAKPEPTPPAPKLTPDALFFEGKWIFREGLTFENWSAIKPRAENWITRAKAEIENYKTQIGPNGRGWTQGLLTERGTICKIAETISKFQRAIGLPLEEIEIPHYRGGSVDRLPKTASPATPAEPVKSDLLSQVKPGYIDGFRRTFAGESGTIVHFRGGEDGLLLDRLTHSDRLEYGEFIDTGFILGIYKVCCTKEFLTEVAPALLKAILTGQVFQLENHRFNYAFGRETIFAVEKIGAHYHPQGGMSVAGYERASAYAGREFSFRLTVEGLPQEWTARDLIHHMAQWPLRAVAAEKVTKPTRPVSCLTLDGLERACIEIHTSRTTSGELFPWLEYLAGFTDFRQLAEEYPEYSSGFSTHYSGLIKRALAILQKYRSSATEAEAPAQTVKPERPLICRTDDDLISVIGTIRRIDWEYQYCILTRAEATKQIASYINPSVIAWLDYLDSDPNILVKEYSNQIADWRLNLRKAIEILAIFRDDTNQ